MNTHFTLKAKNTLNNSSYTATVDTVCGDIPRVKFVENNKTVFEALTSTRQDAVEMARCYIAQEEKRLI